MTITAEADRIDLMQNGAMRIIDYKTGKVPTQTQVNNAINCQLIVEAMIAKAKGFEGISTIPDEITVAYWKLSGTGNIPAKKEPRPGKNITIDEIITLVEDQLVQVMKPETPFLSETVTHDNLKYSDYRHLARVKEWAITSEDEADDHEE
jgi:ATP-dependent helicase/nuclease subunit B